MRVLVVDNYDSFVYNLVQYLAQLGADTRVRRNDAVDRDELDEVDGVLVSPGPGTPQRAGASMELIRESARRALPLLGVCLGHQAIGAAFGGEIVSAKQLMHGKTSMVENDGKTIFAGIKKPFQAMRYHSLVISKESLPYCLIVTAESEDGEIMGVRHREHPTEGIQFHPESIMTPVGKRLLRNFLKQTEGRSEGVKGREGNHVS